jgi:hypothetical protein
VESGKVLTEVMATRDAHGKLVKMSRKLFGVGGDGLRLKAGRRYRVVGEYDNPTGEVLTKGAMASMVGLFVPDDMKKWPAVSPADPMYQRDLASLQRRGANTGSATKSHHGSPAVPAGHQDMHGSTQGMEDQRDTLEEGAAAHVHSGDESHE